MAAALILGLDFGDQRAAGGWPIALNLTVQL